MRIILTYKFGSFLKSQEKMFLVIIDVGVCMHTSHLHFIFFTSVPIDSTFDFTFKMSWEPCWVQSHLDVLMWIWFKVSIHWLQFKIVTTHQTWFEEFKFELLCLAQIIKNNESICSLSAFKLSKIDCFIRESSLLTFISKISSAIWQVLIKVHLLWHLSSITLMVSLASNF